MRLMIAVMAACALALGGTAAYSQDQDKFVSKEDYQKLKTEHDQLKQQLETVQRQMQELLNKGAAPAASNEALKKQVQDLQKESDQAIEDLEKQLKEVKGMAKESFPGTSKFLFGGYGTATYTATSSGYGPSQPVPDTREGKNYFTATFNPIFLWKLSDRLLFEGEIEVELGSEGYDFALEMAHLSYLVNDYMTLSAGKFLNPMDYFIERQHMGWVNKLPDKPLAVYDGLVPEGILGVQLRGAVPVGSTKFGYAFFAGNAPYVYTTPGDLGMGTLEQENFANANNHIVFGGRLGYYILPELEIGYGAMYGDVGPEPGQPNGPLPGSPSMLVQSADLSYVKELEPIKGTVNFHAQWVWSQVTDVVYPALGSTIGNNRNGGYFQLAYRPTRLENPILKNLEPIVRYDMFNQVNTPVGFDEHRWTIGLDYWVGPSSLAKLAYEWDMQNAAGQDGRAFMLQFVMGF